MSHWHLLDSGDADMGHFRIYRDAIRTWREVYATASTFVDSRALYPISMEFPIVKCADPCMIAECCESEGCHAIDHDSLTER